jgi:hypothetical protein
MNITRERRIISSRKGLRSSTNNRFDHSDGVGVHMSEITRFGEGIPTRLKNNNFERKSLLTLA